MPLGYMQLHGTGHFQHMLIDGTERLEFPLAHAIPETTSNVLIPVGIIVVLFFVDWRMAFAVMVPAILTLIFYLPMYEAEFDAPEFNFIASTASPYKLCRRKSVV